jgi:hypothetical protein
MKLRRICLILAALFGGSQLLNADILILKNGEKKEGNILEERADAIRMKYKITPKIWDEKDFPRADIAQIIKQKPEEIEIVELRKVLPMPDLLTADQYEQIIQDKLRPFVNKYPGTEQAKEIDQMIVALQAEKDKVVAGQLKLEGAWLTPEQVKRDDYNIRAFKVRRSMLEKAAEQDYAGALREFDRLADPEQGYPASLHYVKAVPEVIDIMTKYEALITRMIAEQPIIQNQRAESLKKLVEPDLGRTKAAIDREVSTWKATYDAEKKSKVRWLTQYKYDLKALQDALKLLVAERGKLQLLDVSRLQAQNEALTTALHHIADENVIEAEAALKTAAAVALKDSSRIITQLRSRLTLLKTEQAKNKNLKSAVGAGSTAVAGGPEVATDDRVAQAMAEAEKAREAKKQGGADPEKKEGADKRADEKKAGDDKDDAAKAKSPRPKASSASPAIVAPVEEESSTQTYLLIGAAILIAVLLVAFVVQKKKEKEK